jgi:hypothetical protein
MATSRVYSVQNRDSNTASRGHSPTLQHSQDRPALLEWQADLHQPAAHDHQRVGRLPAVRYHRVGCEVAIVGDEDQLRRRRRAISLMDYTKLL